MLPKDSLVCVCSCALVLEPINVNITQERGGVKGSVWVHSSGLSVFKSVYKHG